VRALRARAVQRLSALPGLTVLAPHAAASAIVSFVADGVHPHDLGTLLDELERTLLDIAHSPSQLEGPELKRIQQRIEARGLIFKVRVVESKVRREQLPHRDQGMKNESKQAEPRKQI